MAEAAKPPRSPRLRVLHRWASLPLIIRVSGLILGIIAIVFGRQARNDVARSGKSGRAEAQAGFVLGIIAVIGSIINMIVAAAIIAG